MALQFDPSAYNQVYESGQKRKEELLQALTALPQRAMEGYQQGQEARLRQQANDLAQQNNDLALRKFNYEYGQPIDPGIENISPQVTPILGKSSFMPGGQGGVASPSPLIERFNEWIGGGMKKENMEPSFGPAMGQAERSKFMEYNSPEYLANVEEKKTQSLLNRTKAENLNKTGSEYGKPPAGYRWTPTGALEMIPGGPADQKAIAEKEVKQRESQAQIDQANLAIQKIDQALSKVSGLNTGGMSATKNIPFVGQMTGATDLDADLQTIKAILGFEQLSKMKSQSRAGASGLGALSDNEMRLLVAARANLEQAQTNEQLAQRLNELKLHYKNWSMMERGVNPYENQGGTNPNPSGKIRVRNLKTRQTGSISAQYFDPNKYERLP